MELPFTKAEFFEVLRSYNEMLGPWVLGLIAAGPFVLWACQRQERSCRRAALGVLAFFAALNGAAYHWMFFTRINQAAWLFGGLFVAQAALLLLAAWRCPDVASAPPAISRVAGWPIALYGLVIYGTIGFLCRGAEFVPQFGAAPCPTIIFMLGVILLLRQPVPWWLLPIPIIWVVIGGSAAVLLGVPEDYGLIVAGALALPMFLLASGKAKASRPLKPSL
ncbi:MAG: hypothetical protein IT464_01210 [Planctomycetes bacterium]|nr:hypothetical protein [Planctomycetota bacterium]